MDKILDIKKGKLNDEDTSLYRFQCDCLTPDDAMDIIVDSCGKNNEDKYFTISMYFKGHDIWNRIKYAWQVLRGKWCWREFVVREEDCKDISDIFNLGKKYSELP